MHGDGPVLKSGTLPEFEEFLPNGAAGLSAESVWRPNAWDQVRVSASSGHRESVVGQIREDPSSQRNRWALNAAGFARH